MRIGIFLYHRTSSGIWFRYAVQTSAFRLSFSLASFLADLGILILHYLDDIAYMKLPGSSRKFFVVSPEVLRKKIKPGMSIFLTARVHHTALNSAVRLSSANLITAALSTIHDINSADKKGERREMLC